MNIIYGLEFEAVVRFGFWVAWSGIYFRGTEAL